MRQCLVAAAAAASSAVASHGLVHTTRAEMRRNLSDETTRCLTTAGLGGASRITRHRWCPASGSSATRRSSSMRRHDNAPSRPPIYLGPAHLDHCQQRRGLRRRRRRRVSQLRRRRCVDDVRWPTASRRRLPHARHDRSRRLPGWGQAAVNAHRLDEEPADNWYDVVAETARRRAGSTCDWQRDHWWRRPVHVHAVLTAQQSTSQLQLDRRRQRYTPPALVSSQATLMTTPLLTRPDWFWH